MVVFVKIIWIKRKADLCYFGLAYQLKHALCIGAKYYALSIMVESNTFRMKASVPSWVAFHILSLYLPGSPLAVQKQSILIGCSKLPLGVCACVCAASNQFLPACSQWCQYRCINEKIRIVFSVIRVVVIKRAVI